MPITIGSKTESDYSNPLGLLSDCHRRIERFLDALILVTNRARGGELDKDQRNALEVGLRYFREAAPKHTLDEEESLFPRMHACGDARARSAIALLDALRADHVVVEAEHTVIDALGKRWLSRGVLPAQAVERLAQLLDQLHLTYQRHIAIEDQEVFPVARQILDRAELTNVGLEMAMRRSINLTALESHLRILAPRRKMTSSSRRHDSLIPLSREHQYGLMLCMRIHRGLVERDADSNWLQLKASHAVRFFERELVTHFQAEEMFLFPAMEGMPGSTEVIDQLLTEHIKIRRLIDRLLQIEVTSLATTLKEFADTLEAHIRKEERELFPIYEEHASPETISLVGPGIFGLIGSASRPRHPELLK